VVIGEKQATVTYVVTDEDAKCAALIARSAAEHASGLCVTPLVLQLAAVVLLEHAREMAHVNFEQADVLTRNLLTQLRAQELS
jgi:hypothetical protein